MKERIRLNQGTCMALINSANSLRQQERKLLHSIAELSDHKTAETVADIYAAETHLYSFEGYLYQLNKLREALAAGVPPETAIELVDSCIDVKLIIRAYRMAQSGEEKMQKKLI